MDYQQQWVTKPQDLFDCHCPTLEEVAPGILLASWYGGAGTKQSDNDLNMEQALWSSRFENGVWTDPFPILRAKTKCWNPVLFKKDALYLFYKEGPSPREWVGSVMCSYDEGKSWERPTPLPKGILGPMRTRPLVTPKGKWITGSSVESGTLRDHTLVSACTIEISNDEGKSWVKKGPITKNDQSFGLIQPALFFDQNGDLHLLARDRALRVGKKGFIWTAVSKDEGETWSQATPTALPNPDSAIDVLRLKTGELLLAYNPSHEHRAPLELAKSTDVGKTWTTWISLESDQGEYGYPSLLETDSGDIHLVYSHTLDEMGQRSIKHIQIPKS